jgi:hypothetical protein
LEGSELRQQGSSKFIWEWHIPRDDASTHTNGISYIGLGISLIDHQFGTIKIVAGTSFQAVLFASRSKINGEPCYILQL